MRGEKHGPPLYGRPLRGRVGVATIWAALAVATFGAAHAGAELPRAASHVTLENRVEALSSVQREAVLPPPTSEWLVEAPDRCRWLRRKQQGHRSGS